jgi:ABC-2 type transport system ATP-binding protein
MNEIIAHGLGKHYGKTRAVDDLSFTVRPGRVTGFLGPNGAGKSTTMRMVLGLDRPTSGSVTVDGAPFGTIRRPLHKLGAVLEVRAVHGGRSARNHLLSLAQSNGIPARRVDDVLDLVGLSDVAHRRTRGFSLGMAQRLGLAAALLGDPPILMCDEPVNGLDPEGILWIRTLLRRLAAEGRTVFVSSHLMSEMALTADHLIVIGQGRLIADAPTSDIISASSVNHVLARSPQAPRLAEALRASGAVVDTDGAALHITGLGCEAVGEIAASHQLTLHELSAQNASLEAAYMELTKDSLDFHAEPVAS